MSILFATLLLEEDVDLPPYHYGLLFKKAALPMLE